MQKEMRQVASLKLWEKNPRTVSADNYDRLKKQLARMKEITGEYLYKPLLITPEDIVIGGNQRLRALTEMGITEVWVNVVPVKNEQEMLEVSLSDNDTIAATDSDMLANMMPNYPVDWSLYAADFSDPIPLSKLEPEPLKTMGDAEPEPKLCPKCGYNLSGGKDDKRE